MWSQRLANLGVAVGGTGICVRQGARCKRTASSTTGCSSTIRNLWQPVVILVSHYIFLNSTLTLTLLSLSLTLTLTLTLTLGLKVHGSHGLNTGEATGGSQQGKRLTRTQTRSSGKKTEQRKRRLQRLKWKIRHRPSKTKVEPTTESSALPGSPESNGSPSSNTTQLYTEWWGVGEAERVAQVNAEEEAAAAEAAAQAATGIEPGRVPQVEAEKAAAAEAAARLQQTLVDQEQEATALTLTLSLTLTLTLSHIHRHPTLTLTLTLTLLEGGSSSSGNNSEGSC